MAGHEDAGVVTGHIGSNTPKFAGCFQNRAFADRAFGGRSALVLGGCHCAGLPRDLLFKGVS